MDDVLEGDKRGMGLAAMAQRVSLAGGLFDIWSRENQGVRIVFNIPFSCSGRENMSPFTIVLADDHMLFRQGVKRIIEENKDFKVIGEAGDGLALLELLKTCEPDLVILDISMPLLRGLEAARELKSQQSENQGSAAHHAPEKRLSAPGH